MEQDILEQKAQKILSSMISIHDLSDEDLRTIFAYDMWRDGMEWEDVKEIESDPFWNREYIIAYLQDIFGY